MENQLLDNDMLDNKEGKSLSALLANGYETNSVDYIKKALSYLNKTLVRLLDLLLLLE